MKTPYIFNCNITKYKLEYIVDDTDKKVAYLNTILWDYQNLKAFLTLLRNSIDKLSQQGVNKINQCISHDDWELFLKGKTSWRVINSDENIRLYDIECDINEFLYNFGIGIGLDS
jgi:hypothetical protein